MPARNGSCKPNTAIGVIKHVVSSLNPKYLKTRKDSKRCCRCQLPPTLRVVVMGDANVGKSSLLSRFIEGSFSSDYIPTVEDYHEKRWELEDGRQITLEIVDTTGSYPFPAMKRLALVSGHTFVIVFSLEKMSTLIAANKLCQEIYETKGCIHSTIVFVANKSDLASTKREVDSQWAQIICTSDRKHGFVEASAKNNSNVKCIFKEIFRQYESQTVLKGCTGIKHLPSQNNNCVAVPPALGRAFKRFSKIHLFSR